MYLKALKLHGFKSFADNTTLRYEPGVTAVVGPNGCDKSNIADAIRWVLGEQSAKALRDGQSEYHFNGQPCRLKDIQKLFMDTGVGRTSYSIMAQGQIDQILSSKPEERRAVFEEAAGITKYKSARREAMNKLALTDQNLARVADVVAEVGRQIGSLRRQAAKAMRYKRVSHRLRHLALAWSSSQHGQITAALGDLESKVAGLRAEANARRAS